MSKKLTPWFPHEIKPIHVGIYPVDFPYKPRGNKHSYFAHWNGKRWGNAYRKPEDAPKRGNDGSGEFAVQTKGWRGLANDPKEPA